MISASMLCGSEGGFCGCWSEPDGFGDNTAIVGLSFIALAAGGDQITQNSVSAM